MNKKQWVALLVLYVGYLMFGALVFYFLERDEEFLRMEKERFEFEKITGKRVTQFFLKQITKLNLIVIFLFGVELIEKKCLLNDSFLILLEDYCGKPFRNESSIHPSRLWDFYNSIFFVITVVSTIGKFNELLKHFFCGVTNKLGLFL